MVALGVDTSNYATSLAVVDTNSREVVCAVKKLLPVKEGTLGLRQSDAVFHHTQALPGLLRELLASGPPPAAIGAVGVSSRPRPLEGSYMPCFLAGVSFAAAFAAGRGLVPVHTSHQQGHIQAARFGAADPRLWDGKALVFHVSGGTTELLLADGYEVCATIGGSLDLFAGQAVDRLGVRLGFPFPAGRQLSELAGQCGEDIHPKISVKGPNCHFSGLQNQCEQLLAQGKPPAYAAKYCLLAIADTAAHMANEARRQHPGLPVLCAGGVMSSTVIRSRMQQKLQQVFFVPPLYAGDNAVGTAFIAGKEAEDGKYHHGIGAE